MIAEEPSPRSVDNFRDPPWTVARGDAPAVFIVARKAARIAPRVFPLNERRASRVLEVVHSALTHHLVLNQAKVNPDVTALMDEERTAVEKVMSVDTLPSICRRPRCIRFAAYRVCRRAEREQIKHDRLVVP